MMDENQFWDIIARSRGAVDVKKVADRDEFYARHGESLGQILRQLTPQEIAGFAGRFAQLMRQAYRWDLWGAAYWIGGGCSDDGFTDFRSTLISLGKDRYYRALKDPDSLADVVGRPDVPFLQSEGFQYVPLKVYQEKTGGKDWDSLDHGGEFPAGPPPRPAGERFDFDDDAEMAEHYPKLVAKFPDGDED